MSVFYLNENKELFQGGGIVERFDPRVKEWMVEAYSGEEWLEKNREHLTQISEEEMEERMGAILLENLDREELDRLIQLLRTTGKVVWEPMKEREDGSYQLGYPKYPANLFDVFDLLGMDIDFRDRIDGGGRRIPIHRMDILQIRAQLTYLVRAERFCDGVVADAVDDGTLLKLLLRIKELLDAHEGRE